MNDNGGFGENLNGPDNNYNNTGYNMGGNLGTPQGQPQQNGLNGLNGAPQGQNPYGNTQSGNGVNLNKDDYNYNSNNNYNYQNGNMGQNYQNSSYQGPNPNIQNGNSGIGGLFGDLDPNTQYMIWLISGIVQIVNICCCNVFSLVFGILTVVFASKAKQALYTGGKDEFEKQIKTARMISLIGWIVIILNVILNIALGFFSAVLDKM